MKRDIDFRMIQIPGWNLANETAYWIVLPAITLWAAWALWRLTLKPGDSSPGNGVE